MPCAVCLSVLGVHRPVVTTLRKGGLKQRSDMVCQDRMTYSCVGGDSGRSGQGISGKKYRGGPLRDQPRRKLSRTARRRHSSMGTAKMRVCDSKRGFSALEESSKRTARVQVSRGSHRLTVTVYLCGARFVNLLTTCRLSIRCTVFSGSGSCQRGSHTSKRPTRLEPCPTTAHPVYIMTCFECGAFHVQGGGCRGPVADAAVMKDCWYSPVRFRALGAWKQVPFSWCLLSLANPFSDERRVVFERASASLWLRSNTR